MVHNVSGSKRMESSTMVHNQAVFDARTLVVELPRAGTPVFRAYWPVEKGLMGTEVGEAATCCGFGCSCSCSCCGCSAGSFGFGWSSAIFLANAS